MRVVSWNVGVPEEQSNRGPKKAPTERFFSRQLVQVLGQAGATVFCVQEISRTWSDFLDQSLGREWTGVHSMAAKRAIFWHTPTWEMEEVKDILMFDGGDDGIVSKYENGRRMQVAMLRNRASAPSQGHVAIGNCHSAYGNNSPMPSNTHARTAFKKLLCAKSLLITKAFASSRGPTTPSIVCGDYNMEFEMVDEVLRTQFCGQRWELADESPRGDRDFMFSDRPIDSLPLEDNLNLEEVHWAQGAKVRWEEAPVTALPPRFASAGGGALASSQGPAPAEQQRQEEEQARQRQAQEMAQRLQREAEETAAREDAEQKEKAARLATLHRLAKEAQEAAHSYRTRKELAVKNVEIAQKRADALAARAARETEQQQAAAEAEAARRAAEEQQRAAAEAEEARRAAEEQERAAAEAQAAHKDLAASQGLDDEMDPDWEGDAGVDQAQAELQREEEEAEEARVMAGFMQRVRQQKELNAKRQEDAKAKAQAEIQHVCSKRRRRQEEEEAERRREEEEAQERRTERSRQQEEEAERRRRRREEEEQERRRQQEVEAEEWRRQQEEEQRRRKEEEREKARAEADERAVELRRQLLRQQEQKAREQEEAAEREEDKKKLVPTAMRLPKGGGRTGYVYDGEIAVAVIAQILEMRTNALVAEGLHDSVGPGHLLPWHLQVQIQKERFKLWSEDFKLFHPDEYKAIQEICKGKTGVPANHKVNRELASRFRTSCKQEFGGIEWHNVIIALGLLDDTVMLCMNAAHHQRKEEVRWKKEALGTWVSDEDLPTPGASASSRGPVRGIQHRKSKEKKKGRS